MKTNLNSRVLQYIARSVWDELPKEVQDSISNIIITDTIDHGASRFACNFSLNGQLAIYLNAKKINQYTTLYQKAVLAHELAHAYLGHETAGALEEDEADQLTRKWGFDLPVRFGKR